MNLFRWYRERSMRRAIVKRYEKQLSAETIAAIRQPAIADRQRAKILPRPVLYGIVVGVTLMLGSFLGLRWWIEHEHAKIPPDKMWMSVAIVAVTASEQELSTLIGEMRAFAAEKNLEMPNLPKKGQKHVTAKLSLTPNSFFMLDNYGAPSQRFRLTAYSHEDASVWKPEWEALIGRLRSRLGDDHVKTQIPGKMIFW